MIGIRRRCCLSIGSHGRYCQLNSIVDPNPFSLLRRSRRHFRLGSRNAVENKGMIAFVVNSNRSLICMDHHHHHHHNDHRHNRQCYYDSNSNSNNKNKNFNFAAKKQQKQQQQSRSYPFSNLPNQWYSFGDSNEHRHRRHYHANKDGSEKEHDKKASTNSPKEKDQEKEEEKEQKEEMEMKKQDTKQEEEEQEKQEDDEDDEEEKKKKKKQEEEEEEAKVEKMKKQQQREQQQERLKQMLLLGIKEQKKNEKAMKRIPMNQRGLWDTVSSGMYGMYDLVFSQSNRDEFLQAVMDKVIHQTITTQARLGNLLSLALYHDLYKDPLWAKANNFEPKEFLQGVAPALEQFHEVQGCLVNEFLSPLEYGGDDDMDKNIQQCLDDVKQRTEVAIQQLSHLIEKSSIDNSSSNPSSDAENHRHNPNENTNNNDKKDGSLSVSDEEQEEEVDPDALVVRLSRMVTPTVMDAVFLSAETTAFTKTYEPNSTYVENVALLSARVIEVVPDEKDFPNIIEEEEKEKQQQQQLQQQNESIEDHDDSKDKKKVDGKVTAENASNNDKTVGSNDDSSHNTDKKGNSHDSNNNRDKDKDKDKDKDEDDDKGDEEEEETPMAIAAQIEVLYDVKQTYTTKKIIQLHARNTLPLEMEEQNSKPQESTQVIVGTFEGWLKGGDGPLRWRISNLRSPYLEFPELHP